MGSLSPGPGIMNGTGLETGSVWFKWFHNSFFNTLRPRQNGRHFPDDNLKCIFLNENIWISIKISLKFVPRGPINNIPELVQIMAWRRPGDNPLSEPLVVTLLMHIYVTRPQWVKANSHPCNAEFISLSVLFTTDIFMRGADQMIHCLFTAMTLCYGNAFHITGPLWGESTGHRWIPLTKGQQYGTMMFPLSLTLNNILNIQSSCWWLYTQSYIYVFTVITSYK